MRKYIATAAIALLATGVSAAPTGERLAYVVGCVNCHHQTPKEIINAPPLMVVQTYSLPEFTYFLRTGLTRTGRNLPQLGSIMGIVAVEQFSHMTDDEIKSIYEFLKNDWNVQRASAEEKKIPSLYKAESKKKPQ